MSLHGIDLKDFVRSVSTCTGQEPLGIILGWLLQQEGDRLVVVNSHQHPLGIIRLADLIPQILTPEEPDLASLQTSTSWHQAIQDLTPAVIQPLIVLPEEWSLAQVLPTLWAGGGQDYALVNANAQLVGLLHRDRLLRHLAASFTTPPNGSLPELPDAPPEQTADSISALATSRHTQQQQIVTLTQQLLAQRAELEQRLKVQQQEIVRLNELRLHETVREAAATSPVEPFSHQPLMSVGDTGSEPKLLDILLQLLDRLPVPLMLQTSEGGVLVQNSVWCQQMGQLADPLKIWREAAVWLSGPEQELPPVPPNPPQAHYYPTELAFQAAAISPLPLPQEPFQSEQSLCQLGSQPDHCVCVCPLKDGHERVVQFVKIALNSLLPSLPADWLPTTWLQGKTLTSPPPESTLDTDHEFQLATFTPANPGSAIALDAQSPPTSNPEASPATITSPPPLQSLWLVMAQDVTQQQHLARELTAKNADLVQLNRLKDEFLACISHELKTPLTAVLGLSSLLKDQTLGALNQRQVHYAQLIYQSSRHLMGVVNDILDLTRIETGQLELLYGTVDIATVCNRAFEQAKQLRAADSKTATTEEGDLLETQISLHIEPNLKTLIADEIRLRQMLGHLLSNALKFTQANHPIGLRVSRWGGWIAFTVWDTGIGIPAEKQHLIFQKFQQLENPLTRQFEGAGLGLVLTRRLARLHGGDVTFLSKEGAGSQFTILLPPSPPDKTQLTRNSPLDDTEDIIPDAETHYLGGRVPTYSYKTIQKLDRAVALTSSLPDRLVLIVDAVAQYVETLTDKLTGLGYRVVIARSGTEALEKARRLQPSVIFLNPLLPLLSGWDVLTLLKSGSETQHLPVVITATVIDANRAHQLHADGFLQLPIQSSELKGILQTLILGTQAASVRSPTTPLTILRLFPNPSSPNSDPPFLNLDELLSSQHYRILEADELEQAALLAEVWKPDVLFLDGAIAEPRLYLQRLNHHPVLAALPIVTLDPNLAQTANQMTGLDIFPCLLQRERTTGGHPPDLSTLLQVIQVAAGCTWQPSILAVHLSALAAVPEQVGPPTGGPNADLSNFPKEAGWLQALIQYLQTAGMEGFIGNSWQEVIQQLTSQSVDVLLLCWTNGEPTPPVLGWLAQLRELEPRPPILVLDHRDPGLGEPTVIPLPKQLRELATAIVTPPIAMSELLQQIQQLLQP